MAKLRLLQRFGARLRGKRRVARNDEDETVQAPHIQDDPNQSILNEISNEIAGDNIYDLSPLDQSIESTFRLLTLLPGPKGSQPCCTLSVSTWQDPNRPYEALSYVWGDSPTVKPIVLNRKVFKVRENLYSALDNLRFEDRPRVLWVDAICIDQNSIKERNHQVASMGEIYRNCQTVLVWLRHEDDESESVVNFIRSIFDEIEQRIDAAPQYRDWRAISQLYNIRIERHLLDEFSQPEPAWALFYDHILRCEWWSRAWIVQEFAIAPNATFHIGNYSIESTVMAAVTIVLNELMAERAKFKISLKRAYGSMHINAAMSLIYIRSVNWVKMIREKSRTSEPSPSGTGLLFMTLLRGQSRRGCQDPKDRVYSVLSMVDAKFSKLLPPDYSKSARSTCIAALNAYVHWSKSLDILGFKTEEDLPGYPSWCPSWSTEPSCDRIVIEFDRPVFNCDASRQNEAVVAFSEDESTIHIQGFLISTVFNNCFQDSKKDFFDVEDDEIRNNWDLSFMAERLDRSKQFVETVSSEGISNAAENSEHRGLSIVATTLVAGFWYNGEPDPPIKKDPETGEWWPDGNKTRFLLEAADRTLGRTAILTEDGNLGIASKKTETGDEIWIFMGARTPYVLRKTDEMVGDRQARRLIGPAYIHGVMQGEAIDDLERGRYDLQTVALR